MIMEPSIAVFSSPSRPLDTFMSSIFLLSIISAILNLLTGWPRILRIMFVETSWPTLLSKGVIDRTLYDRLLKTLNYEHMLIRLINRENTVSLGKILQNDMNGIERFRLICIYSISRIGLLDILRSMRAKRDTKHAL